MARYFIEVMYKGTAYAGFQKQENANTIQQEVEQALKIYFRQSMELTCSSRTDAGVHARQNFFHVDVEHEINEFSQAVYHLNAILPSSIVLKNIVQVAENVHARFDALARVYEYRIYRHKNPFWEDRAYFFPYKLNINHLQDAAAVLTTVEDFTTFSKKNTQVKTFFCRLEESFWREEDGLLIYRVKGNRFLRGMVRGLVGTMLRVGTGKVNQAEWVEIIKSGDCGRADFSTPAHGLMLMDVQYPEKIVLPSQ